MSINEYIVGFESDSNKFTMLYYFVKWNEYFIVIRINGI